MNKQETLHGGTAAFIAAIGNALSRNISIDRMHALASSPSDLKRLLLPLIDDDWIQICPLLQNETKSERLVYLTGYDDIQKGDSSKFYRINHVIGAAKAKTLGFLTEGRAKSLAEMISGDSASATSRRLTGRTHDICFPFVRGTEIFAWVVRVGEEDPYLVEIARSDLFGSNSPDIAWYFRPGYEGDMDEYFD